jgi:hypothetical protein
MTDGDHPHALRGHHPSFRGPRAILTLLVLATLHPLPTAERRLAPWRPLPIMSNVGLAPMSFDLTLDIIWNYPWAPSASDAFYLAFKRVIQHDTVASWAHLTFIHSSHPCHQRATTNRPATHRIHSHWATYRVYDLVGLATQPEPRQNLRDIFQTSDIKCQLCQDSFPPCQDLQTT